MATQTWLTTQFGVELPIVQAPMAGSSGVALAVAVARAGGLGSLPTAMLSAEQVEQQIDDFRKSVDAPVNVNFFCHREPNVSESELAAWSAVVARYDDELGVDRAGLPSAQA